MVLMYQAPSHEIAEDGFRRRPSASNGVHHVLPVTQRQELLQPLQHQLARVGLAFVLDSQTFLDSHCDEEILSPRLGLRGMKIWPSDARSTASHSASLTEESALSSRLTNAVAEQEYAWEFVASQRLHRLARSFRLDDVHAQPRIDEVLASRKKREQIRFLALICYLILFMPPGIMLIFWQFFHNVTGGMVLLGVFSVLPLAQFSVTMYCARVTILSPVFASLINGESETLQACHFRKGARRLSQPEHFKQLIQSFSSQTRGLLCVQIFLWGFIFSIIIALIMPAFRGTSEPLHSLGVSGKTGQMAAGIVGVLVAVGWLPVALFFIQYSRFWIWLCYETSRHLQRTAWDFVYNLKNVMIEMSESVEPSITGNLWQKIAVFQAHAEGQLHLFRKTMAFSSGVYVCMLVFEIFAFYSLAGYFVMMEDRAGSRSPPHLVAFFLSIGTENSVRLVHFLHAATHVSREYHKAVERLLFDARLVPVVTRHFQDIHNFEKWLYSLEISSARIFDLRMTPTLVLRIGGVLASGAIGFIYFIISRHL